MTAPDAGHAGGRNPGENNDMNIRQIARNLVWAENPKAGMFFAMTVVSFVLCVVAPALSYVAFAAPPIGKHAGMNWALIWIFTDDVPARLSLLLFLLLLLDAMVLTWSYYTALLRTVFASKRRYAVPLGFIATVAPVLGLLGVVLPCAIKVRVRKALLAFAAMTVCIVLVTVANISDALRPELVVALCLMTGLLHAAVLIHLPPGRVSRWAYAPAVLPIALVAVLATADANLHKQIQKLEADFVGQSRLSMTAEEFKAHLRGGISKEEPPYAMLFSEVEKLSGVPKINPHGADGGPTAEQAAQFEAFTATNADLFARVDALTAQRNLRFRDDVEWSCARSMFESMVPLSPYFRLGQWYLAKGRHAALRGDGTTAVDCIDRIDNLTTWLSHNAVSSSQSSCLFLETLKLHCIEATVTVLSDADLAAQQMRVRINPRDFIERCRMNRIASYILFEDAVNAIAAQGAFGSQGRAARKLYLPFIRFYVKLEKRCALQTVIHELNLFDGDARSEAQLYASLDGERNAWWSDKNVRMPMSRRLLYSVPGYRHFAKTIDCYRAAEIGLAVERYRRRRGRLPEELSEVAPEFLGILPPSTATGKPFEYQRGSFDIPWGSGERSTRRVIGYRVFSRYSESYPRMNPGFTVWLGDAPADGSAESPNIGNSE